MVACQKRASLTCFRVPMFLDRRRSLLLGAIVFMVMGTAFSEDVMVTYTNGKSIRLNDAAFFESGLGDDEEDGVPLSAKKPPADSDISKYVMSHVKHAGPPATWFYIPWNKIEEIQMLKQEEPDIYSHPAKIKMKDGQSLQTNIVLNGVNPYIIGNTAKCDPLDPIKDYYYLPTKGKNCAIRISKVSTIKPTSD
jgi:hypothetical protein